MNTTKEIENRLESLYKIAKLVGKILNSETIASGIAIYMPRLSDEYNNFCEWRHMGLDIRFLLEQ